MEKTTIDYGELMALKARSDEAISAELSRSASYLGSRLGVPGMDLSFIVGDMAVFESDLGLVTTKFEMADKEINFSNIKLVETDEASIEEALKAQSKSIMEKVLASDAVAAKAALQKYVETWMHQDRKQRTETILNIISKQPDEDTEELPEVAHAPELRGILESLGWDLFSEEINETLRYGLKHQNDAADGPKWGVDSITIPTTEARLKDIQIEQNQHDLVKDIAIARLSLNTTLAENEGWAKNVLALKEHSDANELENEDVIDLLADTAGMVPQIVLLTNEEVAEQIAKVFEAANIKGWDTDLCSDMAEGLLETAKVVAKDRFEDLTNIATALTRARSDEEKAVAVDQLFEMADNLLQHEAKLVEELSDIIGEFAEGVKMTIPEPDAKELLEQLSVLADSITPMVIDPSAINYVDLKKTTSFIDSIYEATQDSIDETKQTSFWKSSPKVAYTVMLRAAKKATGWSDAKTKSALAKAARAGVDIDIKDPKKLKSQLSKFESAEQDNDDDDELDETRHPSLWKNNPKVAYVAMLKAAMNATGWSKKKVKSALARAARAGVDIEIKDPDRLKHQLARFELGPEDKEKQKESVDAEETIDETKQKSFWKSSPGAAYTVMLRAAMKATGWPEDKTKSALAKASKAGVDIDIKDPKKLKSQLSKFESAEE